MNSSISIADLIANILTILGVNDEEQCQRMIDEVEQLTQARAAQLTLRALPEEHKKSLGKLSPADLKNLLQQHVNEEVAQTAFAQAVEEVLPRYLAELSKTATTEQKRQIEKVLTIVGE